MPQQIFLVRVGVTIMAYDGETASQGLKQLGVLVIPHGTQVFSPTQVAYSVCFNVQAGSGKIAKGEASDVVRLKLNSLQLQGGYSVLARIALDGAPVTTQRPTAASRSRVS